MTNLPGLQIYVGHHSMKGSIPFVQNFIHGVDVASIDVQVWIGGEFSNLLPSQTPLIDNSIQLKVPPVSILCTYEVLRKHTAVATKATIGIGTSYLTTLLSSSLGKRWRKRWANDIWPPVKYKFRIAVMIRGLRYGRERITSVPCCYVTAGTFARRGLGFYSKDTKESDWCFEVLSTKSKKRT